jgi:hypothetical protein
MNRNTAQNSRFVLANGDPIDSLKFEGSNLAALASNGEINASDKKDLIQSIDKIMSLSSKGAIRQESISTSDQKRADQDLIAQANSDPAYWEALGANIAEAIQDQSERRGFLRNFALGNNLRQGEIQRVPMPRHEVQAVVATSPTEMGYQLIRDRYYTPAEFEIKGNVRVSQLELDQSGGDMMRDIRDQAMESIMVAEDRLLKKAADRTVGRANEITYIGGELTPKALANIQEQVSAWNLPASKALFAVDFWKDVIGNSEFSTMLDPVSKYDLVLNGKIGTLIGLELVTDAFRPENQKVLDKGEIYVVSDPEHHAAYSTRGIRSTPTDGANAGETTKGWLMSENFSFVLANIRSVAKGIRI